ncbi:MAG: hypothetical protein FWF15_08915 [Oscillospiraceae bacterium]|nr:hypothetical protein [Oscillospiraceae bacterium]
MKEFDSLYGNAKLKNQISESINLNKFVHTCIIEGKKGSGKHTLAKIISVMLAGELEDKIIKNICPDIITVGLLKDRKTIGVETIRNIKESVYIVPNELNIKVYIIEDAHLMTHAAQNAFLKLLEEPPKNVYFLLLCEYESLLLSTVKSRAIIYHMQNFPDDELTEYLISKNKRAADLYNNDQLTFDLIIKNSGGTIGNAEELMSSRKYSKLKEDYEKVVQLLNYINNKNTVEILMYHYKIADKRDEITEFVDNLLFAMRDILLYKKNIRRQYMFFATIEDVSGIAEKISTEEINKIYNILIKFKEEANINLNINNMKIVLFSRLLKE